MRMHLNTAIRLTRAAQTAVLLAAVVAATVFVLPAPRSDLPPIEPTSATTSTSEETAENQRPEEDDPFAATGDWTVVVPALGSAIRESQDQNQDDALVQTDDEPDEPDEATEDQPQELPAPPGWRYVGYARLAGALSALVDMEGRQRFVDQGDAIENFTVAQITTDFVIVRSDDRQHRLTLEPPIEPDLGDTAASTGGVSTPAQRRRARRLEMERRRQREAEQARRLQEQQSDDQSGEQR